MNSELLADKIARELGSIQPGEATNSERRPRVPDHDLIRRIGAGSYGDVWLARSITGQWRAIKVVWRQNFSSERPYERELRGIIQFEPISRSHPAVINILHVGRDDGNGCFFYVMQLADEAEGQLLRESVTHSYKPRTLASDLKTRGRMPVTNVLTLGVQLSGALGHLHGNGLVHRDVKPSNVVFVEGQAKLADIGLVTVKDEARSFVGTEGFIPPEGPGSERADIFSLGRLLYEAATGKDRCEFPELPEDLDQWPQKEREALLELNEVLARSCAREPGRRHANAAELAGDLNVILSGRSVRRAHAVERRLRFASRWGTVAVLALLVAGGAIWFQETERKNARTRFTREALLRTRAERAERDAHALLHESLVAEAHATVESTQMGRTVRALDALRRAAAIKDAPALRTEAWVALATLDLQQERELKLPADLTAAAMSAELSKYAVARGTNAVSLHSMSSGESLGNLAPASSRPATLIRFNQNDRFLGFKRDANPKGNKADLEVWDLDNNHRVLFCEDCVRLNAFDFHPNLPLVITGVSGGPIVPFALGAGIPATNRMSGFAEKNAVSTRQGGEWNELFTVPGVSAVRFSPDGNRLAIATFGPPRPSVQIRDLNDFQRVFSVDLPSQIPLLAWHPSGGWIVAPCDNGTVYVIDTVTGNTRALRGHRDAITCAEFSTDGDTLGIGCKDGDLRLWNTSTWQLGMNAPFNAVGLRFSARDGHLGLVTAGGQLLTLGRARSSALRELPGDLGYGRMPAAFSANGRWFAANPRRELVVWDLHKEGPPVWVSSSNWEQIFFTPDSEQLICSQSGRVQRWHVGAASDPAGSPTLDELPIFEQEPTVFSATLLQQSKAVLFGRAGRHQVLPLANLASGECFEFGIQVLRPAVSPDEQWLASYTQFVEDWHVVRLNAPSVLRQFTNDTPIWSMCVSPDSKRAAMASKGALRILDSTTWQRLVEAAIPFSDDFARVNYALNGRVLMVNIDAERAGLYDSDTLDSVLSLPRGSQFLAMSADTRVVAVRNSLGSVELWDLEQVQARLRTLGMDWR